jgi:hypothetical protein
VPRHDGDTHKVDPGFLVVDSTTKKQCLVVSVGIPEGDGLSEVTRMQMRERAPLYQAQQLQAWRDGTAIPMPVRDTNPLDTIFGTRTTVHLSRIGFVHVKRFEDELKAVIECLRVCGSFGLRAPSRLLTVVRCCVHRRLLKLQLAEFGRQLSSFVKSQISLTL